ncbi:MAG TPA: TraR/DksA C4-type zinc finger protein [Kiritimatiellia bacterium]|nr:TraR/DksA C4-type zinc finger protein [Kiritimatiellia bacterium]
MASKSKKSTKSAKKPAAKGKPTATKKAAPAKKSAPAKKPAAKKPAAKAKKPVPAVKAKAVKAVAKKAAPVKKVAAKKAAAPVKGKAKPAAKPAKKVAAPKPPAGVKVGKVTISSAPPPLSAQLPKSVDELLGRPTVKQLAKKTSHLKPLTAKELEVYKKLLLELRDRVIDEIGFLANDNLNKSSKESSGDLSSYSLHMADQGTDNFDREFAASLLNTEYDVLYEIDEALRRIEQGAYGVCEVSGEQIERERLKALPFARCSVAAQSEIEKRKPRHQPFRRTGLQGADFSSMG